MGVSVSLCLMALGFSLTFKVGIVLITDILLNTMCSALSHQFNLLCCQCTLCWLWISVPVDEQPWNAEQARSKFWSWFLSCRSNSSTGQCQWVQWADRKKWPYFYFLYNPLLICIPTLAVIREMWKIQQWPISKVMSGGEDILGQSSGLALLWKLSKHEPSVTNTVTSSWGCKELETIGSGQWLPLPHQSAGAVSSGAHQHAPESALTMSPLRFLQF